MKLFISVSLLVLSISAGAQAGPGASKMAMFANETPYFSRTFLMQKRFIPTQDIKRFFTTHKSTKSYKPENQSPKFSYIQLAKKVEFLDSEDKIFIPVTTPKQHLFKKTLNLSNRRYMSTGTCQMEQKKEINIDTDLVRLLIGRQFPQWKDLPVQPVEVGGWDNRTFHLGNQMLVRMPSAEEYAMKVEKEQKWLPKLAPLLPLSIPTPLAMGEPDENYPWRWSVYRWIEGDTAAFTHISDLDDFATRLAQFLIALQRIDTTDGPLPKMGNFSYIGGLTAYDDETRRAIAALRSKIDADAATKLWERALETTWQKSPVWVHGDMSAGNLLVQKGKLSAVIDFGGLAVGDPACDLVIAWKFFHGNSRNIFRERLPLDAGTWARGRGWALWKAMIVAAGFEETNAVEAAHPWRTIDEVIKDFKNVST